PQATEGWLTGDPQYLSLVTHPLAGRDTEIFFDLKQIFRPI
ncbi:16805_t:CDS:1, partial [Cetraspora pellucida]